MVSKMRLQVEDFAWLRNPKDMLVNVLSIVSRREIPLISKALDSTIIEYYHNPFKRRMGLATEAFLAEYVVPEAGKRFVDVGANVGMWALFVAGKGFEVYAFEPAPKTFRVLKDKANKYANLHVYPYALGEEDSVGKMGLLNRVWGGGIMGAQEKETAIVTIRALDSMNLVNVGVIKIDTEGYETPILKGAKNLINREKPRLVIEVHKGSGMASPSYAEEFEKIKRILESFGYSWVTRARRVGLREAAPFIIAEPSKK